MQWKMMSNNTQVARKCRAKATAISGFKFANVWTRGEQSVVVLRSATDPGKVFALETVKFLAGVGVVSASLELAAALRSADLILLQGPNGRAVLPPMVVRAYVVEEDIADEHIAGDPFAPTPPSVLLDFDSFVLGFDPTHPSEVEYFASMHALQVAHAIQGGDLDRMYTEDETVAAYWNATSQAPVLWEMIDSAYNCTPGAEGQTVEV